MRLTRLAEDADLFARQQQALNHARVAMSAADRVMGVLEVGDPQPEPSLGWSRSARPWSSPWLGRP